MITARPTSTWQESSCGIRTIECRGNTTGGSAVHKRRVLRGNAIRAKDTAFAYCRLVANSFRTRLRAS